MKKIFALMTIAGMLFFFGCGSATQETAAEEIETVEEVVQEGVEEGEEIADEAVEGVEEVID